MCFYCFKSLFKNLKMLLKVFKSYKNMPRVYLNRVFLFRGFSLIVGGSGMYTPQWRGYQCIYIYCSMCY